MVVRLRIAALRIDVATDAETELRILVQHLARLAVFLRQVRLDEVLVTQHLGHQLADRELAVGHRVDPADLGIDAGWNGDRFEAELVRPNVGVDDGAAEEEE